jgi:diguanylate cyclase (GGDEF)-like protein
MKVKFPLKYKIFSVVFIIQLAVVSIFIHSFVKFFKDDKTISAYEMNAQTIAELKGKFESKVFLIVEKLKAMTALIEKNQFTQLKLVDYLDLENNRAVQSLFHFTEFGPASPFQLVEKSDKLNTPDMTAYFGKIYETNKSQFPLFWRFDWNNQSYVGMGITISYTIETNGVEANKNHIFFIIFNQNELFQLKNKNQLAETAVFTRNGQVVHSKTELSQEALKFITTLPSFRNSIQNKSIIQVSQQDIGGKNYLISTQTQSFGDLVTVTMIDTATAFAGVKSVYMSAFILAVASVLFSYFVAMYLSSTITQPLSSLTRQMQNMSKGQLDVVVDVKSKDEVGFLAFNFKQMAADLKNSKQELLDLNRDLENKVAERTKQLEELTIKDPLTGSYNRRFFDNKIAEEIRRSKRSGTPVGLLYLDIDHFKKYNDQNGHPEGDQLLINFAKTARSILRAEDFFCRLGGEEFCVVTVNTDIEGVKVLAEKVRSTIYNTDFKFGEKQPLGRLSCSIGVSVFPDFASDPESLVKTADEALYKAKQGGRNAWVLAEKSIVKEVDEVYNQINKNKVS